MGLVEQASPIHRKKLHLQNTHGGWSDLVHDIDALVLFGKGFGDIMLPAEPLPCASWATMPQGHDFLASTVQMMLELYKKAGSKDQQYLTTRKLRWHRGESILFETCVPQSARCSCERLQRIVPSEVIGAVVGPGPLEEQGAVVFGERGRSVGFDVSRRVFNKLPWLQPRMNSTVNQNSRPNAVTEVSRPDSEEQHTNSFQLGSLVSLRSLVDRFSRFLKA
ncbi:hypothetical protein F5Y10DRAFT_239829 [Nemania abortiva]|nr:hypothetical protein F5Y10DRAFT_239829 [Nemania abortiva]